MSRMFGTEGVRGIANTELTAELAYSLGRAGAFVLTEGTHKPKILVAKDTRISGDMLESALVAGILSVGAEAVILGVVPTPAVAHLTREYNADAGVMISASHNPVEYNGIKFFDGKGYKLSDELEDQIQAVIENNFEGVPSPVGGAVGRSYTEESALREYIDYAKSTIKTDLKGLRVALDCANGAAYKAAVKAFRDLDARVYVINDNPDGNNINENCGSTHMEELMDYVVRKNCHIGFAFDGDADRCLAVDENGEEIDGDVMLAIASKYLKAKGKLANDTLVATVMSNLGINKFAEKEGIDFKQTKVGDRYVLEEMLKNGYNLGGEQSGHIIYLDYNPTGDGILTSLMLVQILLETKQLPSEARRVVNIYPQVLINARVKNERKYDFDKDEEIVAAIDKVTKEFSGNGRVLIRTSGTEPLVRVMIEGENQEVITKKAREIADLIEKKLG